MDVERRSCLSPLRNIKMPNGQLVTIPLHRELKIGLLKAAIRKAGLTEEQFSDLL